MDLYEFLNSRKAPGLNGLQYSGFLWVDPVMNYFCQYPVKFMKSLHKNLEANHCYSARVRLSWWIMTTYWELKTNTRSLILGVSDQSMQAPMQHQPSGLSAAYWDHRRQTTVQYEVVNIPFTGPAYWKTKFSTSSARTDCCPTQRRLTPK